MVQANVKKVCDMKKDDPNLLGYSFGFNPFQIPHKWINHLLAQGPSSPGKAALIETLKRLYGGDIAAFNKAYATDFARFADILDSTDITYEGALNPWPGESTDRPFKRDFDQLVYTVIAKVHEVAHRHVREHDPNHLILGFYFKTYNANVGLYEAIAPYVDVLSPQHHVVPERHENGSFNFDAGVIQISEICQRTGKPIYHGDQWLGKVDPAKFERMLRNRGKGRYPYYHSQAARGQVYEALLKSVLASPQVVGFAGCATLYDNPDINGSHGGNKGLFDTELTEKPAFTVYLERANAKVYDLRTQDYRADESAALAKAAAETIMRAANMP